MCVRWGDVVSNTFSVQNGVKQGGVISPVLDNIYIDNLLETLRKLGYGCYMGNVFSGAIGYADDLVLLSPSLYVLRSMIKVCEKYAHDYDILFNPKKSKLMCFNVDDTSTINITLCKKPVEIVDNVQYLGNVVSLDICNRHIDSIVQNFWYKHNCLRGSFNMANSRTLCRLHSTYCSNVYGSELFNFNCNYVNKLFTAWRKSIRQLHGVHYRTHNFIVHSLSENIKIKLHRKLANFILSMINSNNTYVTSMVMLLFTCSSSMLAENYRYLSYVYGISPSDWENGNVCVLKKIKSTECLTNDQTISISVVKELIDMRDNLSCNFATGHEIDILLQEVCIK